MRKQHPSQAAKAQRIARAKRYKAMARTMTLDEIAKTEKPPITPQRVGQLIASLGK